MKKFEYLKTFDSTIRELNELGSIGWELVNTVRNDEEFGEGNRSYYLKSFTLICIFKREIL